MDRGLAGDRAGLRGGLGRVSAVFYRVFIYLWAPRGGELPADTTKMAAGGERRGEEGREKGAGGGVHV